MREVGGLVHLVTRHLISASCGLGHLPGAGEAHYISLHISRCSVPTRVSPGEGPGKGHGQKREERSGKASLRRWHFR